MTKISLGKGINAGLRAAMENDPKVLVMGEDVGKLGGVFRVTDGLQKDFGEQRVLDTPLFAHVAGPKVVACSNPADAYSMIQQAIACDDPVIFFEPKRRYWEKAVDVDL